MAYNKGDNNASRRRPMRRRKKKFVLSVQTKSMIISTTRM